MTITETTLVIAALGSAISAIGAIVTPIILALLTRQQNRKIDASAENIKKIEVATNSMKDALVSATAKASKAEGLEQGRNENPAKRK